MEYFSGNLYFFGGSSADTFTLAVGDMQIYNIANNAWTQGCAMPNPMYRFGHALTIDRIYAFAGYNLTDLDLYVYEYCLDSSITPTYPVPYTGTGSTTTATTNTATTNANTGTNSGSNTGTGNGSTTKSGAVQPSNKIVNMSTTFVYSFVLLFIAMFCSL